MSKHRTSSAALVAVVALGIVLAPGPAAMPAPRAAGRPSSHLLSDFPAGTGPLTITGLGYGHGRGMGQWGAFGYASGYGWSYQQILGHYYGGTVLGNIGTTEPDITVHLVELDGHNTIAAAVNGGQLVATWGSGLSALAGAFEVTRVGGAQAIYSSPGCGGPWREIATADGPVTLASAAGGGALAAPVSSSEVGACIPGTGERIYQGDLVAQPDGQTQDVVGLEDYVDGVVPAESPASWAGQGGEAALEAQAVAARSYALAYVATSGEICDNTACQMYLGFPDQYGPTADAAVAATAGEVLYCAPGSSCGLPGTVALTEYSASTGGYTAGGLFPPVADLGDYVTANPVHSWTVTVPASQVEAAFPSVGSLLSVDVAQRNGLGELGGRAQAVIVQGQSGSVEVTGAGFAAALGLRSDWFQVAPLVGALPEPGAATTTTLPAPATTTTVPSQATSPAASTTSTVPPSTTSTVPSSTTSPPSPDGSADGTSAQLGGALGPDDGYWVVDRQGMVSAFGNAPFYGTAAGTRIQGQVVAMAASPDYRGYWLAGADGGVLAFGDAHWYGSASDIRLRQPIVAMAATPDGRGYWLVSGDGGVFAYGDALYYGSLAPFRLGLHVTAFAPTPDGRGYWLTTGTGAVFAFGDAGFFGSPANEGLAQPVTAVLPSADGRGYLMVARDGGVFAYGDARFMGSLPSHRVEANVVGSAAIYGDGGYYLLSAAGEVFAFGSTAVSSHGAPGLSSVAVAIVCHRS